MHAAWAAKCVTKLNVSNRQGDTIMLLFKSLRL